MERQIELQILKTRRLQYLQGILLALGMVLVLIGTAFVVDYYVNSPQQDGGMVNDRELPSDKPQIPSDNHTGDGTDEQQDRISLLAAQIERNYEMAVYMRVAFNYTIIINETDFGGWNKDIHLTRINSTTWSAYVWFANFTEGYPEDLRIYNYTAFYTDGDIQQINRLITDGVNATEEIDWDWTTWNQLAGGGSYAYFFDIYYENGTGIEMRIDGNFAGEGVVVYSEFDWEELVSQPWGEFPLPMFSYPLNLLYLSPISAFDAVVAKVHELFSESPPG